MFFSRHKRWALVASSLIGLLMAAPASTAAAAHTSTTTAAAPKVAPAALYNEQWRPQYHFTPPTGWMNDPNGLVYYQGEYHLFYQYYPAALHWGPTHWGHAVSTDLVHWTHLPIALYPDEKGYIFSGSAVVDEHNTSGFFPGGSGLVAIFTYDNNGLESQAIAYSSDRGRTWTKYSGNPVIPNTGARDFRDPKVFWHAPTHRWVMVVAGGEVNFYSSADLKQWRHESTLDGVFTECPDLMSVPVQGTNRSMWVLSLGGTRYYVGEFDGHRFVPRTEARRVDWGQDFYAAQSWNNVPDGRRIWIGWMSNWAYAQITPTTPWRSAMTVPRELTLVPTTEGIVLTQRPVRELARLRTPGAPPLTDMTVRAGTKEAVAEQVNVGDSYEVDARVDIGNATDFGVRLRMGPGGQQTVVGYDVRQASLYLDRRNSGVTSFHPDFATRSEAPLSPVDRRWITVRILVDRSSVEVFANDGRAVLTDQIFPNEPSGEISFYVTSGTVTLKSLAVYQLASIWR
jgi:fructan beta-fructosidase